MSLPEQILKLKCGYGEEPEYRTGYRFALHDAAILAQKYNAEITELRSVAIALRDYIDTIPDYLANQFPAMPDVDRDWVDDIIDGEKK